MLMLIGLMVVWVIGGMVAGMLINTVRASQGVNINDGMTVFLQAFSFGPIGALGAFSDDAKLKGRSSYMLAGGVSGTLAFLAVYQNL
jgi:hypothetical protein